MGNLLLTSAAFRREGQRGPRPSRALIRSDHPAPEAALAALVGPLGLFRWEGEAPAASPEPPSPPPEELAVPSVADPEPPPRPEPVRVVAFPAASRRPERPPPEPPRPSLVLPEAWDDADAWLALLRSSATRAEVLGTFRTWARAADGRVVDEGGVLVLWLPPLPPCRAATLLRGAAERLGLIVAELPPPVPPWAGDGARAA